MEFILSLVIKSIGQVWLTVLHNWPYLAVSVIIATSLKLYVNAEKVSGFLNKYRGAGVVAATAAAVSTPLCSCGTTAVILGMMASTMPWAPIVAFMVSSPLTSPEGLVYSAGIFGWPFAVAFYLASIVLGLAGGRLAALFERRGWLANQARFAEPVSHPDASPASSPVFTSVGHVLGVGLPAAQLSSVGAACGCAGAIAIEPAATCGCGPVETARQHDPLESGCGCGTSRPASSRALMPNRPAARQPNVTLLVFLKELFSDGKRLLIMFLGFAFVGYFLNGLIPASWVTALFGSGRVYSVPLAATLGLPFYINSETSLPLVRAFLDSGMSHGAALAFLIAGSGTSIGAIAGAMTIARWRVVALVVGILWVGAILSGFAFDWVLMLGWF